MTIEDFQSLYLRSILPLFVIANYEGCIFYYVLWRPKYQSPGTRKEHCLRRTLAALVVNESKLPLTRLHKLSSRSLFTSCLLGQHSSVERALSLKPIVCFSTVSLWAKVGAYSSRSTRYSITKYFSRGSGACQSPKGVSDSGNALAGG